MRRIHLLFMVFTVLIFAIGCSKSNEGPEKPETKQPETSKFPKPTNEEELIQLVVNSIKSFDKEVFIDMSGVYVSDSQIDNLNMNIYNKVTFSDSSLKYAYSFVVTYNKSLKILHGAIKYMPYKLGIDESKVPANTKKIRTYNDFIAVTKAAVGETEIPVAILDKNLNINTMQRILTGQCGYGYFVYTFNADATAIKVAPAQGHGMSLSLSKYQQMRDSTSKILARIVKPAMSNEDKVKAIYHFVTRAAYDFRYYTDKDQMPYDSQTAIGVFVNKLAICGGYSAAFNILASTAGIETYNVSGMGGGEAHEWNKAFYNGKFHSFDCTFDRGRGEQFYNYFSKDDAAFQSDHSWDPIAIDVLTKGK